MPEIDSPLAARPAPENPEARITLREIPIGGLVQAAAWRGRYRPLCEQVGEALNMAVPDAPSRWNETDGSEIFTVAPDRLWCLAPAGDTRIEALQKAIDEDTGCTTDLGHSHVRVRIEGPAARRLLATEIAIDLDANAFSAGRIARTTFHHVPVTLQCRDAQEGVFDLFLPRTFAASTWEYLLDLAHEHG